MIVTRSAGVDPDLSARIEALHGRPPLAWTDHQWMGIEVHEAGVTRFEDCQWLSGRRFACRLGIGNPEAARAQLRQAGGEIVVDMPARDHAPFDGAEIDRLLKAAGEIDGVFMTAKDRVKAQPLIDAGCPVPLVVRLEGTNVEEGKAILDNSGLAIVSADDLGDAAKKIVAEVKQAA